MRRATIVLAAIAVGAACLPSDVGQERAARDDGSIRQQQLRYPRVRTASQEKDAAVRKMVEAKGLAYPPRAILLRAFKKEGVLELWGSESEARPYVLDLDWFNPQSNFLLSMHINYPNAADRILGFRANPGGDIFLHGNCASIGCIPITDDGIKEVYWLAVLVKDGGAKHLPIQIFPARMSEKGFRELAKTHLGRSDLVAFWENLKEGFELFEKDHRLRDVRVVKDGRYEFSLESAGGTGH